MSSLIASSTFSRARTVERPLSWRWRVDHTFTDQPVRPSVTWVGRRRQSLPLTLSRVLLAVHSVSETRSSSTGPMRVLCVGTLRRCLS
jgi:hypothetical protein